jgi:pyruvate formate lyase activating enzyme
VSVGRVFDIQRFSVHDGPGIRSTLFLKGCALRCAWCQNPEGLEGAIHLWHFPNLCASCGTCVKACPREALSRDLTAAEAVTELAADRVFYERSGGGVTFSGGEPLQQAGFVAEVAGGLKAQGIHTALETSLFAPWETIEGLLAVIDLFIVDVKLADPARHAAATGQDNATILANLRRLAGALDGDGRLRLRVPLVPGFTATADNLAAVAGLIASIDASLPVELMNFNPLAAAKYRRMGREHALAEHTADYTDPELAAFRTILAARGLRVR